MTRLLSRTFRRSRPASPGHARAAGGENCSMAISPCAKSLQQLRSCPTPLPMAAMGPPGSSCSSSALSAWGRSSGVEIAYAPPFWVHVLLAVPVLIFLPLLLLRPVKGFLLCQQWKTRRPRGPDGIMTATAYLAYRPCAGARHCRVCWRLASGSSFVWPETGRCSPKSSTRQSSAAALDLTEARGASRRRANRYRISMQVKVRGRFDHACRTRIISRPFDGGPGWQIITPLKHR